MTVLVGKSAPDFTAPAVMAGGEIVDDFTLSKHLSGHYGFLLFYPLDFTFVCPSEIIAHDRRLDGFDSRDVKLVGISVDSQFTHAAWRNTSVTHGGPGPIRFPLVADLDKRISSEYGVLTGGTVALRGSFLIDRHGIVRHQVVNDLPLGRNADEALRMIDALQFHEEYGEVCPAGWRKGNPGMTATPDGVAEYLGDYAEAL